MYMNVICAHIYVLYYIPTYMFWMKIIVKFVND